MTQSNSFSKLTALSEGMQIIYEGNKVYTVTKDIADQFSDGAMFFLVNDSPIIIPKCAINAINDEMIRAKQGLNELAAVSDDQINQFYDAFAQKLSDDDVWANIQEINESDISEAIKKGRSTTRLVANDKCRIQMIAGLQQFKDQAVIKYEASDSILHDGWSVDSIKSPLGIVGFVFEGRPNVISDATGVLKSGNVGVFRVGQDAFNTCNAIMAHALYPALSSVGISHNVIRMVQYADRASAWALFANVDLNLAVARGSGDVVRLLGGIAMQHHIPVSLHGTGGAWMMTDSSTDSDRLHDAIVGSLDRKVCNTLNTICLLESNVKELLPVVLGALAQSGKALEESYRVHVASQSRQWFDESLFELTIDVVRPDGLNKEPQFDEISIEALAEEWLWEQTPEVSIVVVQSLEDAIELFNQYSPKFVASLITQNQITLTQFFSRIDCPFVGNGMTRWVDGQYALNSPELGLSNWENGRFLARSAILSGHSIYTTRLKMNQVNSSLKR